MDHSVVIAICTKLGEAGMRRNRLTAVLAI